MTLPELCDDNDAWCNVVCVMSAERLVSAPRRNLDSWVWSTRRISVWVVPDWYWVKRHWSVLLLMWTIACSICWRATRTSNLVDVFTSLLELPVPGRMRYYSLGFCFWIMPMYLAKFLCVPDGTMLWGMHFFSSVVRHVAVWLAAIPHSWCDSGKSFAHAHDIEQYNLILVKGQWCYEAGVDGNSSLGGK